ncbi:hypothetical protein GCK72_024216 [Caenorhabditis remanei]|uniref:Skp1-related protein n=1 Tax=Caenorhabditis remanei TaxID=31234 RepID=E3LEL7_CAERE|nr:hypothetical protein GCK72_024216 [Caenorhabditis remanei]EFO83072.1 hypothetical protein CRE_00341 [Caenorhabditis remanei]KAF1747750.1 hypothetical protein GCK72_024216 [Caenorhabditis remanei]
MAEEFFYKLESSDGKEVLFSETAIKQSKTLSDLLVTLGNTDEVIPMEIIKETPLKKVAAWCEHHKGEEIPTAEESNPRMVEVPEWDRDFLKMSNMELYDLICAANYLDIKRLLNYSCKIVSEMCTGKTAEELRQIFGIPTDEEDAANGLLPARD